MGSKKKNSAGGSHGEKSPKQNKSNGKQQNGVKHRKQSPKSSSPGGKQSEKTKPQPSSPGKKKSDKNKVRSSSSGKWILVVVLGTLVAGGAILYTSPAVHDLVDELMLKYFHPDILSAVHSFIESTKRIIPSKTDSNAKIKSADEGGKSKREESAEIPREGGEQTKDKEKEPDPVPDKNTRENTGTKTKPADKSAAEEKQSHKNLHQALPNHKETQEKVQTLPDDKEKLADSVPDKKRVQEENQQEVKAKPDDKLQESNTKSKDVPKTKVNQKQKVPESEVKRDDKESKEKTSDKKIELNAKSDVKLKKEDKKGKEETDAQMPKADAKTGDKVKQEDTVTKKVSETKDNEKIKQPKTKTKPVDKESKSETVAKSKEGDKKTKDVPDVKSSQKQETKAKPDDKEQKRETVTKQDGRHSDTPPKVDQKQKQKPVDSDKPADLKKKEEQEKKTKPDDKEQQEETAAKQHGRHSDTPPKVDQKQEQKPVDSDKPADLKKKEKQEKKIKPDGKEQKQDGHHSDTPPKVDQKQEQKPADSDKPADIEKKEKQEKKTSADKSDKNSKTKTKPVYSKASITNNADNLIRKALDEADQLFEQKQFETALEKFDVILKKYPRSPRALYGKALTLNELAEQYRSNEILEKCISILTDFLDLPDVPDELYKTAARKLTDRQQFRGWGSKASKTMQKLSERFPSDTQLKNELGVSYLMVGRNNPAQAIFEEVLRLDPSNGFAMVHLGFIVKTIRDDLDKGIQLLADGIATNHPGTSDGRFYFHLGDALQRKNRTEEAYRYYRQGAAKKIFLSEYQRSLYNVDYLTGQPWWTPEETGYSKYIKLLEDNWEIIRDEGLAQLDAKTGAFLPEDENLRETGTWKQFSLYSQGRKNKPACEKAPRTCALIDQIPDARTCSRGQTKFSVMQPGVHVWPHCGPTNCRIRAHLGLVIPPGPKIRVINDTREWKEGKMIIFDDSFEHEVWHDGNQTRLVLIVDFWHPELTADLKRTLAPI